MKVSFVNIFKRISWQFNFLTLAEFLLLVAIWPAMQYADSQWFKEDEIAENFQVLICLACLFVCVNARKDKPIFYFVAFLIILIICREVNTGRHWLCSYYNLPHKSDWDAIPYGTLIKWSRNMVAIWAGIYFLHKKVWKLMGEYLKKAPIYIWDFIFLLTAVILAQVAEKPIDNEIMEEMSEILVYLALFNCIYRYGYGKKYVEAADLNTIYKSEGEIYG